MSVKTFVLDTNVLLYNPQALEAFQENTIIIPMAVIEELDTFKTRNDELGRNSRQVIRRIDDLRQSGSLRNGVDLPNGGRLFISVDHLPPPGTNKSSKDNEILGTAYKFHQDQENVVFVSKDINVRLKADALGLCAVDFETGKVSFQDLYTGLNEVFTEPGLIDRFYENEKILFETEASPNEFLLLRDLASPKQSALARVLGDGYIGHLCSRYENAWNLKPRSKEQRIALELLLDPQVKIVTIVGQAGTGKTLLALACGLHSVIRDRKYERILVSRPIMPFGRDLGYLPGDKDEKLLHWMQPIFDNLYSLLQNGETKNWLLPYLDEKESGHTTKNQTTSEKIRTLMSENLLELEALTYIRGRSIPRQFIIIDEAQNLTPQEIKTIVSRAGEGTKVVLTGDPEQIDNPYLDACSNGLTYSAQRLKDQVIHGHITLKRSERSELAAIAANLL